MPIYKPLPRSAALTREQVEAFERLQESLDRMRDWLKGNDYRVMVLEPVIVGQASSLREEPILTQEYQRLYPLTVTIHTSLGEFTPPRWFAVNIDGELLSRGNMMVSGVSKSVQYDKVQWMSAQLTGVKPIYASDIATAIDKLVAG